MKKIPVTLAGLAVLALAGCGSAAAVSHPAQAPRVPAHSATAAPRQQAPAQVLPLPVVPTGINPSDLLAVRPATIGLSEDGSGWLNGLSWSSWTAVGARGTGYINLDNGIPNMAQGTTADVNVTITLSGPTSSDHPVFTQMTVTDGQGNSSTYAYTHGYMATTSSGLNADVPAPPPAPAPAPTSSNYPDSGDPVPGSATGPACTTIAGMFPGGEPGHEGTGGFCVPDQ